MRNSIRHLLRLSSLGTIPLVLFFFAFSVPLAHAEDFPEIINVAPDGGALYGPTIYSGSFTMSTNIRYFTFYDEVTNQILYRDRQTMSTQIIAPGNGGNQFVESMSGDGRFVVFQSNTSNILPGVSGDQLYIRDMQTGTVQLVTRTFDGSPSQGSSLTNSYPIISSDGRYVAFVSNAPNLVTGFSGSAAFVRDMQTGTTQVVSKSFNNIPQNVYFVSSISSDGRYILFTSDSPNIIQGVGGAQVYMRDMQSGTTELISKTDDGSPAFGFNYDRTGPAMSNDQRYIVFTSNHGTNLNSIIGPDDSAIILHDRQTGHNELISKAPDGTLANCSVGGQPTISGDGRYVTYSSCATNMFPDSPEGFWRIYVYDRQTNTTKIADLAPDGSLGNNDSIDPVLSSDGKYIAFYTYDTNLGVPVLSGHYTLVLTKNPFMTDVVNQAPVVSPLNGTTINEGVTYTESGSFTDSDSSTSWTGSVDYGDGSGAQTLPLNPDKSFTLSHLYKDNGTYDVTVTVTDDGNSAGTTHATVTVNNVAPSVGTISAPSSTAMHTAFTAQASFSDPGVLDTHTAVWDWGDGNTTAATVTESNGSGSVSDIHTYATAGTYTVTLTVTDNDGAAGTNTKSITAIKQLTALAPAKVWVGLQTSQAKGIKYDLLAEAYKNGVLVTSGQLNSVDSGGAGFGNANQDTIPFNTFTPVDFPAGTQLSIKLSVRNACSGSKNNGRTAELWYNDSAANSQFGATIGDTNNSFYMTPNSVLSATFGVGPKQTVNVDPGAQCSAFKPFGTWNITP